MYASGEIDDGQYRAFQRDVVTTENKLQTFEGQLRDVEKAQKDAGDSATKMATDSEKAAGKTEKVGGRLIGSFKKVATAAATMGTAAVAAIVGLAKSQDEYLGSMARLEANATEAGYSMEGTEEIMRDLALVTTDADERVEALSNTMASGFDENQAADALEALGGAAVKWSDTLKIEGLADGLQETLATGAAIGPFAELLDRAGIPLEAFNEGLAEAKKKGEEHNYVLGVLADSGLADSYQAFKDNNEELAASREASDEMQAALGDAALAFTPLVTAGTEAITPLLAKLGELAPEIGGFLDSLKNATPGDFIPPEILSQLSTLRSSLGELSDKAMPTIRRWYADYIEPVVGEVSEAFASMAEDVIPTIQSVVGFVSDNWPQISAIMGPIVKGIADTIGGVFKIIAGIFKTVMAVIRGDWSAAWDGIMMVFSGFAGIFRGQWGRFLAPLDTLRGKLSDAAAWFVGLKDRAIDAVKALVDKVKSLFDFKLEWPKIKTPHFSVQNWSLNPVDWVNNGVPKLKVDWYASGGSFAPGSMALVGVGDQNRGFEHILRDDQIVTLMRGALEKWGRGSEPHLHFHAQNQSYSETKRSVRDALEAVAWA